MIMLPSSLPLEIETLTKQLVAIPSISRQKKPSGEWQENDIVCFLSDFCTKNSILHQQLLLKDGRAVLLAQVNPEASKKLILSGHLDTVGVEDYRELAAFDSATLENHFQNDRFLYGRGAFDMKSGLAVGLSLLKYYQQHPNVLEELGLIFLAFPDEEWGSAGVIRAAKWLAHEKQAHKREFLGCINLDYVTNTGQEDPKIPLYTGTIGKMLPFCLITGDTGHVGEPTDCVTALQIGAKLVQQIEKNETLIDQDEKTGQKTAPPTCLHFADLKHHYDVQLPRQVFAYFNFLTFSSTSTDVLHSFRKQAIEALRSSSSQALRHEIEKQVVSYQELRQRLVYRGVDEERIQKIEQEALKKPQDQRQATKEILQKLLPLADLPTPNIVIGFAPPFYLSSTTDERTELIQSIQTALALVKEQESEYTWCQYPYYPYISDLSFLHQSPEALAELKKYQKNTPASRNQLDFDPETVATISMPITNIGPLGYAAHQREERVEKNYSFRILPKLLHQVIQNVAKQVKKQ